jgi:polyisoprenoid-binding protein YceI
MRADRFTRADPAITRTCAACGKKQLAPRVILSITGVFRMRIRTRLCLAALLAAFAASALAAPVPYTLQADKSVVGFETDFTGGILITGKMPVASAELSIDFNSVAASTFDVTVNAAKAWTSNPLATEAMTGKSVLAVRDFPTIHFASTKIRPKGKGAEVTGNMTIRGVTRPVTMTAQIYRQKGTAEGDRTNLSILLTGSISRKAFGAEGFPEMVGDEVRLKILARITKGS